VEHTVSDYVKEEDFVVSIIDRHIEKSKVNIKNSPIIVAGGYGMGSKENFQLLYQLANVLGAEVGASRAAVDAGFAEHELRWDRQALPFVPRSTSPAVYRDRYNISLACRTVPLSFPSTTIQVHPSTPLLIM